MPDEPTDAELLREIRWRAEMANLPSLRPAADRLELRSQQLNDVLFRIGVAAGLPADGFEASLEEVVSLVVKKLGGCEVPDCRQRATCTLSNLDGNVVHVCQGHVVDGVARLDP